LNVDQAPTSVNISFLNYVGNFLQPFGRHPNRVTTIAVTQRREDLS